MMKTLPAILLASASLAQAQTPPENATLQALLTEVRQLRLALERSASVAPMIQLTLHRIQIQQTEVARASAQLETLRAQMAKSADEQAGVLSHIKSREALLTQELDATQRKNFELEVKMTKVRLEQQAEQRGIQDAQQRAQESELAGRLYAEQSKMTELTERLNSLEKMLLAPAQSKQQ